MSMNMRGNDYNFFTGYELKKEKKETSVIIATVALMLVVLAVLGTTGYLMYDSRQIQAETEETNRQIETLLANDDIARINEKKELLAELEGIVASMDVAKEAVEKASIIDEKLLLSIVDCIPIDVQLSSYSISGNNITFTGTADIKPAIAELEYNLKNLESAPSVFVPAITRAGEGYSFSMNIVMGGGEQ